MAYRMVRLMAHLPSVSPIGPNRTCFVRSIALATGSSGSSIMPTAPTAFSVKTVDTRSTCGMLPAVMAHLGAGSRSLTFGDLWVSTFARTPSMVPLPCREWKGGPWERGRNRLRQAMGRPSRSSLEIDRRQGSTPRLSSPTAKWPAVLDKAAAFEASSLRHKKTAPLQAMPSSCSPAGEKSTRFSASTRQSDRVCSATSTECSVSFASTTSSKGLSLYAWQATPHRGNTAGGSRMELTSRGPPPI